MARRALPGLGLTGGYSSGDDGWTEEMNSNMLTLSVAAQLAVESMTTALPGSPSNGDIYIVPTAGANQWKVAVRENGAWVYLTPRTGWVAWVKDSGKFVRYTGTAWTDSATSAIAVRDEGSSVLTAANLNFVGAGVTATSDGSGGATITIPGGGGGVGGASEANFAAPPVASTWTQQNFDATRTSLTDFTNPLNGVRIAEAIHSYGNTNALRAALRAVPGTNWQATARVRRHTRLPQFGGWGLVVRDASGGRSCILGFINEAGGIGMLKLTNDTTYNSFQSFGGAQMPWRQDIWLRLKYDGTECTLWHSFDGVYWSRSAVVSASALWNHLTNPATHVGFGYNINNNGAGDIGNELDLLSWQLVSLS